MDTEFYKSINKEIDINIDGEQEIKDNGMLKFTIVRDVMKAEGYQEFTCEANNIHEALGKFKSGDSEMVDHETEVTELSEIELKDIVTGQSISTKKKS